MVLFNKQLYTKAKTKAVMFRFSNDNILGVWITFKSNC